MTSRVPGHLAKRYCRSRAWARPAARRDCPRSRATKCRGRPDDPDRGRRSAVHARRTREPRRSRCAVPRELLHHTATDAICGSRTMLYRHYSGSAIWLRQGWATTMARRASRGSRRSPDTPVRTFLGKLWWQGVAAIVGAVALLATIVFGYIQVTASEGSPVIQGDCNAQGDGNVVNC